MQNATPDSSYVASVLRNPPISITETCRSAILFKRPANCATRSQARGSSTTGCFVWRIWRRNRWKASSSLGVRSKIYWGCLNSRSGTSKVWTPIYLPQLSSNQLSSSIIRHWGFVKSTSNSCMPRRSTAISSTTRYSKPWTIKSRRGSCKRSECFNGSVQRVNK